MLVEPSEFYVKRNAEIIRQYLEMYNQGELSQRKVIQALSEKHGLSKGLVTAVVYNKSYPHAAEAWEIVKNEQKTDGVKVNLS